MEEGRKEERKGGGRKEGKKEGGRKGGKKSQRRALTYRMLGVS